MEINKVIHAFSQLGDYMLSENDALKAAIENANYHNKWFTEESVNQSVNAIATQYLNADKLQQWLANYSIQPNNSKTIGLVMAGNICLVGFHDFLTILISGNKAQIKLSSKDKHLLPHLAQQLVTIQPAFANQFEFVDRLKSFDAVIATGSNNSTRYFNYYFKKYPHVIRKNRNSVAVLSGNETEEEIQALGHDVFDYFGLGCRSVSKLYVPQDYDFSELLAQFETFSFLKAHDGYRNNYDYNRTLLLMNSTPHHASDFLMISENESLHSPIASLFFEYYDSLTDVQSKIKNQQSTIQCVVSSFDDWLPLGQSQQPQLWDYADDVDTMRFLAGL